VEARVETPPLRPALGVGGEPTLWYAFANKDAYVGGRAFVRANLSVSPRLELRADLLAGALTHGGTGESGEGLVDVRDTNVPVSLRVDVQWNVTPSYSLSAGIEGGFVDDITTVTQGGSSATSSVLGMVGLHASWLTIRFGARREFQVNVQEGLIVFPGGGGAALFEQTVGFAYLFGGAGAPTR